MDSLKQLAAHLKEMPDEIFSHHVNQTKNDFAAWIKHSLGEVELHDKVQGQISKIELELEVLRHTFSQLEECLKEKKSLEKLAKKAPIKKTTLTQKTSSPKKTTTKKVVKKASPKKKVEAKK